MKKIASSQVDAIQTGIIDMSAPVAHLSHFITIKVYNYNSKTEPFSIQHKMLSKSCHYHRAIEFYPGITITSPSPNAIVHYRKLNRETENEGYIWLAIIPVYNGLLDLSPQHHPRIEEAPLSHFHCSLTKTIQPHNPFFSENPIAKDPFFTVGSFAIVVV